MALDTAMPGAASAAEATSASSKAPAAAAARDVVFMTISLD
jgi:hypothetical protein